MNFLHYVMTETLITFLYGENPESCMWWLGFVKDIESISVVNLYKWAL